MDTHLIVLCGPTGIGKTRIGIELASNLNCEIISADSRQIYEEMSIGTAVPSPEELAAVPHHFIHSHSIHENFNASKYEDEVIEFLGAYFKYNRVALLVGGSGMYIDAVCKGIDELPSISTEVREKWLQLFQQNGIDFLCHQVQKIDPEYYDTVDRNNPKRLLKALEIYEITGKPYSGFMTRSIKKRNFQIHIIGLNTDRSDLYVRINSRVDEMMNNGLLEEAKRLHEFQTLTPLKTVGYSELFSYLEGKSDLQQAIEEIKNHSRAYARRQLTWFRRYKDLVWFEPHQTDDMMQYINSQITK